jgi:hypothetical protein
VSQRCPIGTSVIGFDDIANLICTGDTTGCTDFDDDGFFADCVPLDCDDGSATAFPENPEVCDSEDNNCNGLIDEGGLCDGAVVPSVGDIQIVEVMVNPSGSDFQREWIEIFNLSGSVLNLNGCWVASNSSSLLTAISGVGVGQFAVLASTSNPAANGGLPQVDILTAELQHGNSGGQIYIGCGTFALENAIDLFQYSSTSEGVSVQIDANGIQCNSAGSTYGDGDTGTPGAANPDCP